MSSSVGSTWPTSRRMVWRLNTLRGITRCSSASAGQTTARVWPVISLCSVSMRRHATSRLAATS